MVTQALECGMPDLAAPSLNVHRSAKTLREPTLDQGFYRCMFQGGGLDVARQVAQSPNARIHRRRAHIQQAAAIAVGPLKKTTA